MKHQADAALQFCVQSGKGFFAGVCLFFLKQVTEHIQISLRSIDLYLVSNHQTKIATSTAPESETVSVTQPPVSKQLPVC